MDRPILVIVSGPPAAGKSSLTAELRDQVQLPLLALDAIKEAVMDVLPPQTVEDTDRLGEAAERVLTTIGARLLEAGPGAILESAFQVAQASRDLRPLAERSRAVVIHCEAPKPVLVRRYRERAESGERDPGHMDRERERQLPRKLEEGEFEPPRLGVPVLRVDTSDRYDPPLDEVVAWVRRSTAPPR